MSLVGLADDTWSKVVLSDEEKSWWKGGDAVMFVILVEKSEN